MKWDVDESYTNSSYKMTAYYPLDNDYLIIETPLTDVRSKITNYEYLCK